MEPTTPSPAHVLVVDDELALAETLAESLTDRGFRATATRSATTRSTRSSPTCAWARSTAWRSSPSPVGWPRGDR
jgi:CheY-like chemotaxis protein